VRASSRARALPARALLLLTLLLLGGLWGHRNIWQALAALPEQPADFANYHRAAQALLAGESPYQVHNFDYPPLMAFLVVPLAPFPETTARRIWMALGLACLLGSAWLLWRLLGGDRSALLAVAGVWTLAGTQAENLVLGQVHPLLLLLLVVSWWSLTRAPPSGDATGGRGGAGERIAVALAAALKLWPAVLVGVWAADRNRRACLVGIAAVIVALVLSWAALLPLPPPHMPSSAGYWMGTPALLNFSLPAVALRLANPPAGRGALPPAWVTGNDPEALRLPASHRALGVGVALLTLLLGGFCLARASSPGRLSAAGRLHASAALVALALAASPIAWYHYQLFQLPGLALLAVGWWRRGGGWGHRLGRLAGLGLLTAGLTRSHQLLVGPYLAHNGWTAARPLLLAGATGLVPMLTLLLFALHLRELGRTGRAPGPARGELSP